tara:strand:- start:8058 stop:9362 length:1305 start_codon:yes stop_codon:yes gene_type:complete
MYSKILKSLIMPLADKVMQTKIMHFYNEIKKMQNFTKSEIVDWQEAMLKRIITHSYNNTEYYNNLFKKNNLKISDIKKLEDLDKIPVLTKELIRNNFQQLQPKNLNNINYKNLSTGGSSGDPLKFLIDYDSWSYIVANKIVYWEKTGYKYGNKYLAIGSTSLFINDEESLKHQLYYRMKNKIGVNGVNMSDEIVKSYVELIKSKKIKFLYGYASGIFLLAKYALEKKYQLNIKAVFPTSEVLTDFYRETILKAFNCIIMDEYGAHDGGIIAFETNKNHYEIGYNSFLRYDNYKENIGDVLLTNLQSFSMPFINYRLGDKVEVSKNKSIYNGQIINKVYGRESNVIFLENGNVLTGPGFTILFKDLDVESYSISKIDINFIKLEIKKLDNFSNDQEKIILETLKKQAGDDIKIEIKYVEEFDVLRSGKRKYFYAQ